MIIMWTQSVTQLSTFIYKEQLHMNYHREPSKGILYSSWLLVHLLANALWVSIMQWCLMSSHQNMEQANRVLKTGDKKDKFVLIGLVCYTKQLFMIFLSAYDSPSIILCICVAEIVIRLLSEPADFAWSSKSSVSQILKRNTLLWWWPFDVVLALPW